MLRPRSDDTIRSEARGITMAATQTTSVTADRGSRIRPQTLAEYVERALSTHVEHLFLAEIAGGESVTYGEAKAKIATIRDLLHTVGTRPGDRVALLGANSVNWALSYFALVTSG